MNFLNHLQHLRAELNRPFSTADVSPDDRAGLQRRNAWLLSRHSWPAWLAAAMLSWAAIGVMVAFGWPLGIAVPGGIPAGPIIVWQGVTIWFAPNRLPGQRWRTKLWYAVASALLMLVWAYNQLRDAGAWQWTWAPLVLIGVFVLSFSEFLVYRAGRLRAERERDQLRLTQESEAAARQAAEARLKLLQAQIQPHFLFNTLASLQHWVDSGDARGAPLLRTLTAFLRGATELMTRDEVTLADELPLAEHYLAIMRARVGERLSFDVRVSEAALKQPLPPGLLLTLVENAVEHGVGGALHEVAVRINADATPHGWCLRVADSGPGLRPGWQPGVGLANLRERLQHRYGERAHLQLVNAEPGTVAEVSIAAAPARQPH